MINKLYEFAIQKVQATHYFQAQNNFFFKFRKKNIVFWTSLIKHFELNLKKTQIHWFSDLN